MLFVGFGAGLLVSMVAVLYPAYASMQAVKAQRSNEYKQWLSYWSIYATLNLLESVLGSLLLYLTSGLYHALKLGFVIFLVGLPGSSLRGA